MLKADQAPYFQTCPRCGEGGLERLSTHTYCVNCNYDEIYSSGELCAIPQWALDALKVAKPKAKVQHFRPKEGDQLTIESAV